MLLAKRFVKKYSITVRSFILRTFCYHPPGVRRPGREAEHSPPSSAKDTNGGVIPPLVHMSLWLGV
jgi:hypothetical protein